MSEKKIEPLVPQTINEDDKRVVFEQYKLLIESLNNSNTVRETANPYWVTVTGLGLGGISYVKEVTTLPLEHKTIILWTLIGIGIVLCLAWINYLRTMKYTIDIRNRLIEELENYFPAKVFTQVFRLTGGSPNQHSLTMREMLIPILFLMGYIAFGISLYFFKEEVALPSHGL